MRAIERASPSGTEFLDFSHLGINAYMAKSCVVVNAFKITLFRFSLTFVVMALIYKVVFHSYHGVTSLTSNNKSVMVNSCVLCS